MPVYEVFEIPCPPDEAHITGYSAIRLLGLQTDAHAFGSTYERESKFTRDQWRERLDTPGRTTFVVRAGESSGKPERWVGTAGVLSPEMLDAVGYVPPKHLMEGDEVPYILVGMWIHPNYRRQGLGKRLIDVVQEKVRVDPKETRRRVLILEVHNNNVKAKALYESFGFQNRGSSEGSGEIWMSLQLQEEVIG